MKKREARLNCMRKIIQDNNITSQDKLLEELFTKGFSITQATLSRDLKYLKAGKVFDGEGGFAYFLPKNGDGPCLEKDYLRDIARGFISCDFSGSICVIRTLPGHADSVARAIDKIGLPGAMGTIAGDDTIFILLRENAPRENLKNFFQGSIPKQEGL